MEVLEKVLKHKEVVFVICAVMSMVISVIFYSLVYINEEKATKLSAKEVKVNTQPTNKGDESPAEIYVDITGSVMNPGVYAFRDGSRIKDLLEASGGFSTFADKAYFYRNYNLAHILSDQDKIYVPSVSEVESGVFIESSYYIEQSRINPDTTPGILADETSSPVSASIKQNNVININTSSKSELESLKGIGSVTAEKIIQNRPYASLDDLVEKKVLSANVLNNIRSEISL